jgi:hypothetical protein
MVAPLMQLMTHPLCSLQVEIPVSVCEPQVVSTQWPGVPQVELIGQDGGSSTADASGLIADPFTCLARSSTPWGTGASEVAAPEKVEETAIAEPATGPATAAPASVAAINGCAGAAAKAATHETITRRAKVAPTKVRFCIGSSLERSTLRKVASSPTGRG